MPAAAALRVEMSTRLKGPDVDVAEVRAIIVGLPVEVREALAHLFQPAALRACRLAERDELLLRLALGLPGDCQTVADQVHAALTRYAETRWRRGDRDRVIARDPADAALHRILVLGGGKVPAARSLRRIFPVAKISAGNGHGDMQHGLPEVEHGRRHQR